MLIDYLVKIEEQRIKNPNHKKDYRVNVLPVSKRSWQEEIQELHKYPLAKFSNIIKRDYPLFKNEELNNGNYYIEFVHTDSKFNFENWKYLYIPLNKANLINNNYLPYYKYYDVDINSNINNKYALNQILVNDIYMGSSFFVNPNNKYTHPLVSHFKFTGHFFLNKNGKMIYEYKDISLYSDDNSITYYSINRPLHFHIQAALIENYGLEVDASIIYLQGNQPSCLELYNNEYDLFIYTGRSTNKNFSAIKKWYEYRYIGDSPKYNKILLPYAPTNLSLDFVTLQLTNSNIGFKFNNVFNTQQVSINQISSNNKIIYK